MRVTVVTVNRAWVSVKEMQTQRVGRKTQLACVLVVYK